MPDLDGTDKYFDSRDAQARIEELEDFYIDSDGVMQWSSEEDEEVRENDQAQYEALIDLRDEAGSEWPYGQAFISEDYFEEYAQEMAYDVGFVERNSSMDPYIDWERWAEAVKMDYTVFDFLGTTYYSR